MTANPTVQLIEFESMLHASTQRVGRAVRNMRQEMGGFSSTTPGNGSPGGGKGGRSTATLEEEPGALLDPALDDVDPDGIDVPCTSVERQALGLAGRDIAADRLVELDRQARRSADGLGRVLRRLGLPMLAPTDAVQAPDRMVVLAYSRVVRARRVVDTVPRADLGRVVDDVAPAVVAVFHLCQTWGYDPKRPIVRQDRADLLAVDLTERWCTSHLRIGVKRDRSRGELCDWCYRHGPLLVPSWNAPPRELVQLREDQGKVYAHQIDPLIRAERDRQRRKAGTR